VRSAPGTGTTFTVALPISEAPGDPHSKTGRIGQAPVRTSGSTVLYIEDNSSNVDLLAGILRRRPDWTMTQAGTGGLGLELAKSTEPTVILLDLHLPDIDGIDVMKVLQANPKTSGIPVAILSADATGAHVSRLLDAGAQKYFTKPIDVTEIYAFLDANAR
jgi:DNA-binding response OmpR family regulator